MYARHEFHRWAGIGVAVLLHELRSRQAVYLPIAPSTLEGVRGLFCRIGGLPQKAALHFCCEGRSVPLRTERAFCVSINCYNPARSWHFELEVCIMRYRIESGECGSSEQCVIATAEGDDIED